MKKLFLLMAVLLLAGALVAFAGGQGEAEEGEAAEEEEESYVFRLAETHAEDYPTTQGNYRFAQLVEERTDGRIQIEVYPDSQLGEESDVIEQVQFGGIDMTRVSISPVSSFVPELDAFQMPFLYEDPDHMWEVLLGEIGEEMFDKLEDSNFVGLTWYEAGARSFYTTEKVETVEDLEGMNIRVQEAPLMMDMVELLDAVPTPMPFGEVYSGLQTGVIDGAENNWPSYYSTSHYEVAPYYIENRHTMVPEITIMNKEIFDELSEEDQEIIKQAAWDSIDYQREEWAAFVEESKEAVLDAGVEVTEPSSEVLSEMQERMQPLYDEQPEEVRDMIERIRAVRD
ncbi:MAG: TRAP transporter substrate-binding protein [Spirochaetaceae bacterium]